MSILALTWLASFSGVGDLLFRSGRARAAEGGVLHAGAGVHITPRYRQFPWLTRTQVIWSEIFLATTWFWILWRFWHDSEVMLSHCPHCPSPDPSQWTDEELGIPPDDED
nr:NADH dehydrogenase [ubiquinone] 1 beta subcomplex subunit 2, mitochondrial-like [Saimiri boliviensis boliviensis]